MGPARETVDVSRADRRRLHRVVTSLTDRRYRDSADEVASLARKFEDAGVTALIHTDIERDGMLSGVNVEATAALARAVKIPVIASGGVASLDDLRALKAAKAGIAGVISGRALYDGRLDLAAALALLDRAKVA